MISSLVGNKPTPSFNFTNPTFSKSSSERPKLVGSLGIATCAPSGKSAKSVIFLE